MNIFLIGYRATGKSTLGKILSKLFKFKFIDLDKKIELEKKCSISEIVEKKGWERFRELETKALFNIQNKSNNVIATGGGVVLKKENRRFLKNNGVIVWLFADLDTIIQRLKNDDNSIISRPALTKNDLEQETKMLLIQREPLYSELSSIKLDTTSKSPEKLAHLVEKEIQNDRE